MIITTKHTAGGKLTVRLDGYRMSIDKLADCAIQLYRRAPYEPIDIINERGQTIRHTKHIHACIDTFSVYYDAQELKAAIRRHAERR